MFKHLAEFKRIFVTGPHRSGTTICAIMIAHDVGYKWYKEDVIGDKYPKDLLRFAAANRNFVLQCPSMCPYMHEIATRKDAVIFMRRPLKEILASQKRIGWDRNDAELKRYDLNEGVIAEVKLDRWTAYQKALLDNPFEVYFRSLARHPLWVPKRLRKDWKPRQTRIESKFTWDSSESHKKQRELRRSRGKPI